MPGSGAGAGAAKNKKARAGATKMGGLDNTGRRTTKSTAMRRKRRER